jgi:hypothetical protein
MELQGDQRLPSPHVVIVATRRLDLGCFVTVSRRIAVLVVTLLALAATPVRAQDLVPGAYTPGPIRFNVITFVAGFNKGEVAFDPALPVTDAHATIGVGAVGLARSFSLLGRYANIGVGVPYANGHIEGLVLGQPTQRSPTGLGDITVRLAANLYGARAMSPAEFGAYKASTIVGVSLTTVVPVGHYDPSRALNIGTNRWAFKPELGVSRRVGPWTFEGDLGMVFFTDNTNFLNGGLFQQAPIVAMQGHVIRAFKPGLWAAVDGNFWRGGRVTTNGVPGSEQQQNSRVGATLAVPVARQQQLRVSFSVGAYIRLGGKYNALGLSYSYVWR